MSVNARLQELEESGDVQKRKLDSILLRYIARRVHLTLRQLDHRPSSTRKIRPLVLHLRERRGHIHRLAIYQPQEILAHRPLYFLGFLSKKQKQLRPSILQAIGRADKKLVEDLANAPGILSYSSLELRNGDWCNLVVLGDVGAKAHLKSSETHQQAAYHLSHSYYEWIRLHEGVMPQGLDHMEMQLQKSRYYTFHQGQSRPSVRELVYEAPSRVQPLPNAAMLNYW
jgi:hypothetical protein